MSSSAVAGVATRTALVRAARKAFARNGFDGASVRTITHEAHANLGAITYHFGSKRALYEAVLEEGLMPLAERVLAVTKSEGSALDRMSRVVETYFEYLETYPDLPHLLLQEVTAGRRPPAIVRETILSVKQALAGLQLEGEADGSIRPGDPVLTALSVIAQPIYLTLVAPMLRAVAHVDLSDPETRQAAVKHATEFVRHGLEPRKETSA